MAPPKEPKVVGPTALGLRAAGLLGSEPVEL